VNWNLSCPDWVERLKAGRSLVPDLPLDLVAGNRAVAVFNKLRLADVPGTPTMEEAGGEWFRDIVRAVFGSVDKATGRRFIRDFFNLVPKKNSKTTDGALLMLTALLLNQRPRAPMGLAAPVQDVAEIAFNAMAGAIDLDPVLGKKLHVRDHLKTIVHRETKATLEVMTFDPQALTGPKWAAFMLDEVHQIAKLAKAQKAFRQIKGGMLPYPEAFLFEITTQSDDPPVGIFETELAKARAIRDGKLEGPMLPVLYEFPEEMQKDPAVWRDPANWPMVTPNLGKSIEIRSLIEGMKDAEQTSDAELRAWASQHLNVQIGIALKDDGWAGALFWEEQGDESLRDLDRLLGRIEVATVGIDGGGLDDLLGLQIGGRERETGDWLAWHHAWIHPVALERRKKNETLYRQFAADGDLTIVQRMAEDLDQLVGYVKRVVDAGLLAEEKGIGVDQQGIEPIVTALLAGIPTLELERDFVGITQGGKMVGAIGTTERRLADGTYWHGGTRLMAWCASNAKPQRIGNGVKITKEQAGSAKVDPLLASFNSNTLLALNPASRLHSFQILHV
jgi:phage terminase large subunit-like protein